MNSRLAVFSTGLLSGVFLISACNSGGNATGSNASTLGNASDETTSRANTATAPEAGVGAVLTATSVETSDGAAPDGHSTNAVAASSMDATDLSVSRDNASQGSSADSSVPVGDDAGTRTPVGWGAGTPDICTFDISGSLSSVIPTVGVVDWSTDLAGLTEARIEFLVDEPQAGEVNIGSGGPISPMEPQALLLGLKPSRSYTYRIVVGAGETECSSADQKLVTAADPEAPVFGGALGRPEELANGFVLACLYGGDDAVILDADNDVVWHFPAFGRCARAHMDWDGRYMWMMAANTTFGSSDLGSMKRVRMDGSGEEPIAGLEWGHHDFAVLPDGATAHLLGDERKTADRASYLVERSRDGEFTTLARLDADTYFGIATEYHANAVRYHAHDDSLTVSDLWVPGIVKFNRQGQVQWQVGTHCEGALASQCATAPLSGNHGHQLLDNGNLLYFTSTSVGSGVHEYRLSLESGVFTATLEWSRAGDALSVILGDVQRLPNGNTLLTYSSSGEIHELNPAHEILRKVSIRSNQFGYSSFRETLYGAPQ